MLDTCAALKSLGLVSMELWGVRSVVPIETKFMQTSMYLSSRRDKVNISTCPSPVLYNCTELTQRVRHWQTCQVYLSMRPLTPRGLNVTLGWNCSPLWTNWTEEKIPEVFNRSCHWNYSPFPFLSIIVGDVDMQALNFALEWKGLSNFPLVRGASTTGKM